MKGLVVINGYADAPKFFRQGQRIAEELNKLGVQTELVKNGEICAVIEREGSVKSIGEEYAFAVYLDKDKYLGKALEERGLRLFNRPRAIELCDDKFSTYQALLGRGVSLIKSISAPLCYTQGAKANKEYLDRVSTELGFPLVAKKSYGSFGAGVALVENYEKLEKIEQEWLHIPHFYQEYIAESSGRDIRALVIGGEVVAAMERVAKSGEFRSNIELGGEGRKIALCKEYKEIAALAARSLDLDYCGVDLLKGKEGAIVCEVNSNAFFEGLERTTGVNVAKLYAEYISRKIKY